MSFKQQRQLDSKWAIGFAAMLILSNLIMSNVSAQDTAMYHGLQPNESMTTWLVLGPIPISEEELDSNDTETQRKAFDTDFLAAHGGETGVQPTAALTPKIGSEAYEWQLVQSESDIVNLIEVYGQKNFAVAYAWAEIDVSAPTTALLGVGSDDGIKIWLNGKLAHENWIGRPVRKDEDLVSLHLSQGKNQLLIKVQNMQQGWGFTCRALGSESLAEKLLSAAGRGDLDTLELLLSHGVDINAKKYGLTALHYAKMKGREDVVKLLLEKGADANIEMPPKEAIVDALFNDAIKGDSSGASVLVAQNGEILYKKGFGYANLEHHVPVTPETKFRIGSISKQFTAAAILKLQEEGLLSVSDPLSKFVPDYPRGDEVTVHHLLTHTSGIHSYTSKGDFLETVMIETKPKDLIDSFKNDDYDFDPGEKWLYNNSGYFLLGYIVERISGESFEDYLKDHFFDPLGMKDTGIHRWNLILEHEAAGYSYIDGKFQKALNWDMSRAGGAGALYSTVGDLYRWNKAFFNGEVLSEETLKAAFTPATLNDGSVANAMGGKYGYGWMFSETRGMREIAHGGGLNGWAAYLARYPEGNLTVAVLTNCVPPPPGVNPSGSAHDIAEVYLWEQMKSTESFVADTTVDANIYDDYVGRYDYVQATMTVTKEGDRLFAQLTGQPKFEIFPKSENEFFWKVVDAQMSFVKNEAGEVTHAIHRQGGAEFEAPKLEAEIVVDLDVAIYDAYAGEYDYGHGAILTVTRDGNQLYAQMTGQPKIEIFPKSETEFFWKIVNAQVTFVKGENGKVVKAIHRQAGNEIEAPKVK